MSNVVLTGFMGSGKSSVAIKLSYRLKKAMLDTDRIIEKRQGKKITEIFEQDGEDAFRQMETETLRSLKESSKNDIISVGGGTPMREENRALMKEIGTVVYLRVTPETVYERVKADNNRPLLQCEDPQSRIRELLEKRGPLYEAGADVIIDVDNKNFGQILFEIEKAVRQHEYEQRAKRWENSKEGFAKEGFRKDYKRTSGGFNGFGRFHDASETALQAEESGQPVSQHAQNIQFALQESAQRQERWQKKAYQSVAEAEETEKEDAAVIEEKGAEENVCTEVPENAEAVNAAGSAQEQTCQENTEPEGTDREDAQEEGTQQEGADVQTDTENAEQKEETGNIQGAKQEGRPVRLLVINGPNLNFLGIREKGVYGSQDYNYLLNLIARKGIETGTAIEVYQSNHEGAIIDRIQAAYFEKVDGIVINPGAYTHYSYAIRDALASVPMPKVEVHISNIMEREPFRQISVTAPVCNRQIYGQGLDGYLQAINFILDFIKNS